MAGRTGFIAEARGALTGVMRFVTFDKSGAELFSNDPRATARSFWACALTVPFFLLGLGIDLGDPKLGDPVAFTLARMVGFVIGCVGTPLFALMLLHWMGVPERWPITVYGYNWLSLAQNVPLALCLVLEQLGLIDVSVEMVVLIACYMVESFMFTVLLNCGMAAPIVLTLFDLLLGFGIDWVTRIPT
jgi:hypothetical protein